MTDELPVSIRDAEVDDIPLILSSWCKSQLEQPHIAWMPKIVYMTLFHDFLEAKIAKKEIEILVACDRDEPSQVFGWLAFNLPVVHYAYTKQMYRGLRIAHVLIATAFDGRIPEPLIATHTSRACFRYQDKLAYDPSQLLTTDAMRWFSERMLRVKWHSLFQ